MTVQNARIVKTQMLIRKPIAEVFEAFVDPAITTKFWFTKSSGRLEPGKEIRWDWEMYGASAEVNVKEIEPRGGEKLCPDENSLKRCLKIDSL